MRRTPRGHQYICPARCWVVHHPHQIRLVFSPPPPPHAAVLKHGKNLDKLHVMSGSKAAANVWAPSTPSCSVLRRKLSWTFDPSGSSDLTEALSAKPLLFTAARRPTSMQVPNGKHPSGTGPRHAFYGSSVGRTTGRVFSTPTPTESVEELLGRSKNVPLITRVDITGTAFFR